MDSAKIDRVERHLRVTFPHAVEHGTYPELFQRHDRATNIRESADGPPVYLDGGVAAGGYTYRPTGEVLTGDEFHAVCALVDAPEIDGPGVEERARMRREKVMYGRTLTAQDRRRNSLRAQAYGSEGSKYAR